MSEHLTGPTNKPHFSLPIGYVFAGVVISLLLVTAGYFFVQYQGLQKKLSLVSDDTKTLVKSVGRHVLLPSDEVPTVLTVTDKEKLSGQEFFAHASNGDKVLVYEGAKKAFLYAPEKDLVLEIGPVNFSSEATTAGAAVEQPVTSSSYRVTVYNGTSQNGVVDAFVSRLGTILPTAVVVGKGAATSQSYTGSFVVDVTGTQGVRATQLAQALGMSVRSLPEGEIVPQNSEFLIILGADNAQ